MTVFSLGDNDALLLILLIPRMTFKVEILLSQVREKLTPPGFADGLPPGDEVAASQEVERYAYSTQLSFLLYSLLSELHRWTTALNTCSPEEFLKVGLLQSELSIQEKSVDFFLELLRKSQVGQ